MSGATSHAHFVYFIKSAPPALPDDEAYFMSCDLQSPHSSFQSRFSKYQLEIVVCGKIAHVCLSTKHKIGLISSLSHLMASGSKSLRAISSCILTFFPIRHFAVNAIYRKYVGSKAKNVTWWWIGYYSWNPPAAQSPMRNNRLSIKPINKLTKMFSNPFKKNFTTRKLIFQSQFS